MNVNEIITLFRRQSEEPAYTYDSDMPDSYSMWSNFQLIEYLNEAQEEFAERTYIFKDGSNFSITVASGVADYSASGEILKIEKAELVSNGANIIPITVEEFNSVGYKDDYGIRRTGSWLTRTGIPQYIITDIDYSTYRVFPIPTSSDTIRLTVRRLPLNRLTSLSDDLEVPVRYQFGLIYKLQKEAYATPKALLAGYGDALSVSRQEWESFLVNSFSSINKATRRSGKIRYGGI